MKIRNTVIVLGVLSLTLWLSTQSVVGSKLLELQIHIEKDVIQNFELSSRVLELQFRRQMLGKSDTNAEIKEYALASQILNEPEPEILEISWFNRGGIAIVNSVRLLSFKPLIDLWKERELLLLLKYAFYLERHRHMRAALKEYDTFLNQVDDNQSNTHAFALLHQAYCYILIGNLKKSIENIDLILEDSPGTHYAETGAVLARLIRQRQKQRQSIQKEYTDPKVRAESLFEAGDFSAAKKIYDSIPKLSVPIDLYRFARVKEETGEVKKATGEYKQIVDKNTGTQAAKLANRRLLLIGNLYGGADESIRKYAAAKAIELGDAALVKSIQITKARLPGNVVAQESLKIRKIKEEFKSKENISVVSQEIKAKKTKAGEEQSLFERFTKGLGELGVTLGIVTPTEPVKPEGGSKISDPNSKQNTEAKDEVKTEANSDSADTSPPEDSREDSEALDLSDTKIIDEGDSDAADFFLLPTDEEGIKSGKIELIPVVAPAKKEGEQEEGLETSAEKTSQELGLLAALGSAVSGALEVVTSSAAAPEDSSTDKLAGETPKEEESPKPGFFDRIGSALSGALEVVTPSAEAPEDSSTDKLAGETPKEEESPKPGLFDRIGSALSGALEVVTPSAAAPEDSSTDKLAGETPKGEESPKPGLFDRLGSAVSGALDAVIAPSPETPAGVQKETAGGAEQKNQGLASADIDLNTGSSVNVKAAEQVKENLAIETGLDVEQRKQIEIEEELKPVPYIVLTVEGGRQIWGQEVSFVYRYLRVRFQKTSFLIKPEKFRSVRAVTIKGNSTASISPHYMTVSYGEEEDKKSFVLSNIAAKESEEEGGKVEGFVHQGEFIAFEDLRLISLSKIQ